MSGFIVVLVFLALGFALQRLPSLPEQSALRLNQYAVYVAVPAVVLLQIPRLQLNSDLWVPLLTPWAVLIGTALFVWLVSRWRQWPRDLTAALLIILPLGNTSFLGFPIVESFFGADGLAYAVLYDQLGSFLGLSLFATTIAALYGQRRHQSDHNSAELWRSVLLRIVRFPPFIALLGAAFIAALNVPYPALLSQLLAALGATLVPAVMLAVGLQLRLRIPSLDRGPFLFALAFKLVLVPALVLTAMTALGLQGLAVKVSVLEAAMPPMITAGAVAMAAGLRPKLVSAVIGYGLLCSTLTLPVWYWLINISL